MLSVLLQTPSPHLSEFKKKRKKEGREKSEERRESRLKHEPLQDITDSVKFERLSGLTMHASPLLNTKVGAGIMSQRVLWVHM